MGGIVPRHLRMEAVLTIAETVFYVTMSLAVFVLAPLMVMLLARLLHAARAFEGLVSNLHRASSEAGEWVHALTSMLGRFAAFFTKKRTHGATKNAQ